MSRNSRKCCVCGKKEYGTYKENLFFAAFPLNEDRCREWVRLVGNPELVFLPIEKLHTNRYVCENHFEKKAMNKKRTRLKKTAVPKLSLPFPALTDEQLKEFPQHMWNFKKGHSSKECSTSGVTNQPESILGKRKTEGSSGVSSEEIPKRNETDTNVVSSPKKRKKEESCGNFLKSKFNLCIPRGSFGRCCKEG